VRTNGRRPIALSLEIAVKRRLFVLTAFVLLLAQPAFAQPAPAQPAQGAPIDIGPAVGARIPAFAAVDSKGAPRTFASLTGRKGVVLVFFRSARWCPFCQHQLIDLKTVQAPLAERGYTLAAISYDPPEALTMFAEKQGVGYTLLSDDGSKMIDAFKLRDPQYPAASFAYGVPKPSIFVIDRKGVVRAKLAYEGFKVRPDNAAILKAVDGVK
jgi:peroxiredoxin